MSPSKYIYDLHQRRFIWIHQSRPNLQCSFWLLSSSRSPYSCSVCKNGKRLWIKCSSYTHFNWSNGKHSQIKQKKVFSTTSKMKQERFTQFTSVIQTSVIKQCQLSQTFYLKLIKEVQKSAVLLQRKMVRLLLQKRNSQKRRCAFSILN